MLFCYFTAEPSYERTSKIEKLLFSLMVQRHVCTFRHAQRAAYRTAISAAQTCFIQNRTPLLAIHTEHDNHEDNLAEQAYTLVYKFIVWRSQERCTVLSVL